MTVKDTDWMKPVLAEAIEKLRPGFLRDELSERQPDGSYLYCARGAILSALTGKDWIKNVWYDYEWREPVKKLMDIESALGFNPSFDMADWNNEVVTSSQQIIKRFSSLLS